MAFNTILSDRIRECLLELQIYEVEEKLMFGGICFMLHSKMAIGVIKDDLFCRIGEAQQLDVSERAGCRPMDFQRRPMKGYVFVSEEAIRKKSDLIFWLQLCLNFNAQVLKKVDHKKKK
jgi:TfoX/Sxy family transcriptional regulator of competence genes